jgi:hypothetical protein
VLAARFRRSREERLAAFRNRPILFAVGAPSSVGKPKPVPSAPAVDPPQSPQRQEAGLGLAPTRAPALPPACPIHPVDAPEATGVATSLGSLHQRIQPHGIAISARVMAVVGDVAAGVLLSQLIYGTRRGSTALQRDGWIFKSTKDWQRETGMTWKVQRRARAHLLELGLIEERLQTMPARLEFRLQVNRLCRVPPASELELH